MRADYESLEDGDEIRLYPRKDNPLYDEPHTVIYSNGYFFPKILKTYEPDYYFGDVFKYNLGFEKL